MMQKIMGKFMLSCAQVTELMEKKLEQKLSFGERTELFFHKMMCDACRQYEKQSQLLEKFFKTKKEAEPHPEIEIASAELEEKIIRKLNKNPDNHDDN